MSEKRKRSSLFVRMTDEELAELKNDAAALGHADVSKYARALFIAARRRVRPGAFDRKATSSSPDGDALRRELSSDAGR